MNIATITVATITVATITVATIKSAISTGETINLANDAGDQLIATYDAAHRNWVLRETGTAPAVWVENDEDTLLTQLCEYAKQGWA